MTLLSLLQGSGYDTKKASEHNFQTQNATPIKTKVN